MEVDEISDSTNNLCILEADKEKELLYDDLGIIGEISYDEELDDTNERSEEFLLRTPKTKRPTHDVILKCRTPEKPRRNWRFNRNPTAYFSNEKPFTCGLRKSPYSKSSSSRDISILSLPYEIVLYIFRMLNISSLGRCLQVCRLWNNIANDKCLWKKLNLRKRTMNILDLQNLLRNQAVAISLNSATISNDRRNNSWLINNSYYHGNNTTPVYTPVRDEGSSPMRDPFSRVYYYEVQHLDFTNANISPTTLCLILTRCKSLVNLSLENLISNHHVLGCISNCLFLTRLNLTLCKEVTISGVIEILLACNRLTELNLSWSSICRYPPEELVSRLPPTITHLNLGGFRDTMQDGHVAEIVARCRRLQDLDVSDSNHLTSTAVDMLIHGLSDTLKGVNMSRCYSVAPDSLLRFVNMPNLQYLDVFGIMDDASVRALSDALPHVNVSMRPFSAIARPTPSMVIQGSVSNSSIWEEYVKL
ncbi:S-phase kinase-associated protein 2-like [Styela clava]